MVYFTISKDYLQDVPMPQVSTRITRKLYETPTPTAWSIVVILSYCLNPLYENYRA